MLDYMTRAQQYPHRTQQNVNGNHPPSIKRSKFKSKTQLLLVKGTATHKGYLIFCQPAIKMKTIYIIKMELDIFSTY